MNKLLLLGSVAGACPPKKAGGTERVAYVQAKELAKKGINIIFVGGVGSKENFTLQLQLERENASLLEKIEFIEIGGNTQMGNASDSIKQDLSQIEASRTLRLEMVYLGQVQKLMVDRQDEYQTILNNMRGEAILLPLAETLQKKFVTVMHLNLFPELATILAAFNTKVITISDDQRVGFDDISYLQTIHNPVNTEVFTFGNAPREYALMLSTIGFHKNQKDAILACREAGLPLVMGGKIRDRDYFEKEIQPHIDDKAVTYVGEIGFDEKLKLYQEAKVFLFPILWNEPFGLVLIEALSCGTPVIAYPNGGPKEIITDGKTGFLVNSVSEMAEKIRQIGTIDRKYCREDVIKRFDDAVIGNKYVEVLKPLLQ